MSDARVPTDSSKRAAIAKLTTSIAEVWQSRFWTSRATPMAPTRPSSSPASTSDKPWRLTSRKTSRGLAERQTDANLARALRDRERKHADQADGSQQRDQTGKRPEQGAGQPMLPDGVAHPRLRRLNVDHGLIGIHTRMACVTTSAATNGFAP
jgi:hypothetical protein